MFAFGCKNYEARLAALLVGVGVLLAASACSDGARKTGAPETSDGGLGIGGSSPFVAEGSGGTGGTATQQVPTCAIAEADGQSLIDDFDDGNAGFEGNGRRGDWWFYDDETGSRTPELGGAAWVPEPGGITADGYALHTAGAGFTDWGAGLGASFTNDCAYDASVYEGITFWARGSVVLEPDGSGDPEAEDVGVVKVLLREVEVVPFEDGGECDHALGLCWDWHKVRIELGPCWRRYVLPFSRFEQDGWGQDAGELELDRLLSFGLEQAAQQRFDYWFDEFSFYRGQAPEPIEDCTLGDLASGAGGSAGAPADGGAAGAR